MSREAEADDLAVLADGVALGDLLQRDLVPQPDAAGEGDGAAGEVKGLAFGRCFAAIATLSSGRRWTAGVMARLSR